MKKLFLLVCIAAFIWIAIPSSNALANSPKTFNYQANVLGSDNKPITRSETVQFKLYDNETGGTEVWSEVQFNVNIQNGYLNVYLGQTSPLNLSFDKEYWLEVTVGSGSAYARTKLSSVPYSMYSIIADTATSALGLVDNALENKMIKDGALTWSKFNSSDLVAGGDLQGTYPNPKIRPQAILDDITTGSITKDKLAPGMCFPPCGPAYGDLTGTYPDPLIAPKAVKTDRIDDAAVTTIKIADGAIIGSKITNLTIDYTKLNSGNETWGEALTSDGSGNVYWGHPVASALSYDTPTIGNVYMWNGSSWVPTAAAGDVTGSYNNLTVRKLLNITLSAAPTTSGQIYMYNGSQWIPATAGGDVSGLYNNLIIGTGKVTSDKILDGTILPIDMDLTKNYNFTGNITAPSATFNNLTITTAENLLGSLTVTGPTILNGATTINNTLNVLGLTTLGTLNAGATTLTGLTVNGNEIVNGTLNVTGLSTLASLGVTNDETIGGKLTVTGLTTLGTLNAGLTTLTGLTVNGNEIVNGSLNVTGLTTLATLGVTGNETVGGTLTVAGLTTLGQVNGASASFTALTVSGNETVGGTLNVTGLTSLGNVAVAGNQTIAGTLGVTGNTSVTNIYATGSETIGGSLTVSGPTYLQNVNGTSATFTNAQINGDERVTGTLTTNNLIVLGTFLFTDLSVSGKLTVGGASTLNGATTINNTLTAQSTTLTTLAVTGNETVGGTLNVTGVTTLGTLNATNGAFSGSLTQGGYNVLTTNSAFASSVLSDATVTGTYNSLNIQLNPGVVGTTEIADGSILPIDLDLTKNYNFTGNITAPSATFNTLNVTTNEIIGGTLNVTGVTTLGTLNAGTTTLATLGVTGNEIVGGTLTAGSTTVTSLNVINNELVGGTLTVTGATTLNGATIINNTLNAGATTLLSLNVTNNETVGGTLNVTGLSTLGALSAGSTTLTSLNVINNELVGGTLTVTGATTLNGATTINNTLNAGATSLLSLGVTNNETVGGTLNVTGLSTLGALSAGSTTVTSLNVINNELVGGTLTVTGATTLNGATTINNTLNAGSTTLLNLGVTNNETVGGTLTVTGLLTLLDGFMGNSAAFMGDVSIGGKLSVSGLTTLSGLSAGSTTLSSLNVTGNEIVGGTLNVTGVTTLGTLNAGATTLASNNVTGNEIVSGTFTALNNAYVGNNLTIGGTLTANLMLNTPIGTGSNRTTAFFSTADVTNLVATGANINTASISSLSVGTLSGAYTVPFDKITGGIPNANTYNLYVAGTLQPNGTGKITANDYVDGTILPADMDLTKNYNFTGLLQNGGNNVLTTVSAFGNAITSDATITGTYNALDFQLKSGVVTTTEILNGTILPADLDLTQNYNFTGTLQNGGNNVLTTGNVVTNSSLQGNGTSATPFAIKLSNQNNWTTLQTFTNSANDNVVQMVGGALSNDVLYIQSNNTTTNIGGIYSENLGTVGYAGKFVAGAGSATAGNALEAIVQNTSSTGAALYAKNIGSGSALYATNVGSGLAIEATSNINGVNVAQLSGGALSSDVLYIQSNNTTTNIGGIYSENLGTVGYAGKFVSGAGSATAGNALEAIVQNSTSTGSAVYVKNNGTGFGIDAQVQGAYTGGTGSGVAINAASTADNDVMDIYANQASATNNTGAAIMASSERKYTTIYSENYSISTNWNQGNAGYFITQGNGTASAALVAISGGSNNTGAAIRAEQQGTGASIEIPKGYIQLGNKNISVSGNVGTVTISGSNNYPLYIITSDNNGTNDNIVISGISTDGAMIYILYQVTGAETSATINGTTTTVAKNVVKSLIYVGGTWYPVN